MSDYSKKKKGGNEQNVPEEDNFFKNKSILEYQNKALASLNKEAKQEIAQLRNKIASNETDIQIWQKTFCVFTTSLQRANELMSTLLIEQYDLKQVDDPMNLTQFLEKNKSSQPIYQALISLLYQSPIYQSIPEFESQNMEESKQELKIDNNNKIQKIAQQIGDAFITCLQRYVEALKHETQKRQQISNQGKIIFKLIITKVQGGSESASQKLNSSDQLQQIFDLQQQNKNLQERLASKTAKYDNYLKNQSQLQADFQVNLSKLKQLQNELDQAKDEISKLNARVMRGAPYFGIIKEFFPDHMPKMVDENHVCACNYCGQTMLGSTDQSSNPPQPNQEELKKEESQPQSSKQQDVSRDVEMKEEIGSPSEKNAQIDELNKKIYELEQLTQVYEKRLDKVSHKQEFSEDLISKSSTYKLLMEQALNLVENQQILKKHLSTVKEGKLLAQQKLSKEKEDKITQEVKSLEKDIQILRQENLERLRKIEELGQQVTTLTQERDQAFTDLKKVDFRMNLEQEADALQNLNRKQYKESQKRVEELERKLQEVQKKYDDCKRAYIDVKSSYNKVKEELKEKQGGQSQNPDVQEKYNSLKHAYKKLDEQKKEFENKVANLEQQQKDSEQRINDTYADLESVYSINEQTLKERAQLIEQISQLDAKITNLNNQIFNRDLDFTNIQRDRDQFRNKSIEQQDKISKLEDQLKLSQETIDKQTQYIKNLEQSNLTKDENFKMIKNEMEQAFQNESQAKESLDKAKQMIDRLEDQIALLKVEVEKHEQKNKAPKRSELLEPIKGQLSKEDIAFMKLKLKKLQNKFTCTICNEREKSVILPCLHMFCEDCIMKNIESRQRQCPLDRKKFTKNEVSNIFWGEDDEQYQ